MSEEIKALKRIAIYSSIYEEGTRYCDFCGKAVFGKRQSDRKEVLKNHTDNCPISILRKVVV